MERWQQKMGYTNAQAAKALGYSERGIRLFRQTGQIPYGTRVLMSALLLAKRAGTILKPWRV